jgi:integrase/recombinase XerD
MPIKLSATISKIQTIKNKTNLEILKEFTAYMQGNGLSENHQNNNLKIVLYFAKFIGDNVSFYEITKTEQIMKFLDARIKSAEEDPDKRWIVTWNSYLNRIKLFYRWLYNRQNDDYENWVTPPFSKIKNKKSKRISPI